MKIFAISKSTVFQSAVLRRAGLALAAILFSQHLVADAFVTCQCRDRHGQMVSLGTVTCFELPTGRYLAKCEMSMNTPYWAKLNEEGCPQA